MLLAPKLASAVDAETETSGVTLMRIMDWCFQVGWDMKARAGKKPVVLELGGNAACVIEDYRTPQELDAIVKKLMFGAYYQSGQSCISVQRLFVRQVRLPCWMMPPCGREHRTSSVNYGVP
jgi:hypothetical protein